MLDRVTWISVAILRLITYCSISMECLLYSIFGKAKVFQRILNFIFLPWTSFLRYVHYRGNSHSFPYESLTELGYEIPSSSTLFPRDTSPTGFHLFRSLGSFLRQKMFRDRASAAHTFKEFTFSASKNQDFFERDVSIKTPCSKHGV